MRPLRVAIPDIPDTPAELIEIGLRGRVRELERDLASAEARVESLERRLIACGEFDPELGP